MKQSRTAIIIGAGASGLGIGYELSKAGWQVQVFEQHEQTGGLARSTALGDTALEAYYHFICGGDKQLKQVINEVGLDSVLHWHPTKTSYYVDGKLYPFSGAIDVMRFSPLSLISRLRLGLHAAMAQRFTDWSKIEHLTAEQWLIDNIGRQAYETVWKPLLRLKFGEMLDQISAPWMWHRIWRVGTSRESLLKPEKMGYLEGGFRTLFNRLQELIEQAGGSVKVATPVREIVERDGKIIGVRTDEGLIEADAVISTAQLPALLPMLPEALNGWREQLSQIKFVGVVCLLARAPRNLTDCFWVNINDVRVGFNGVIEYSRLNPWPEGKGDACFYSPLYLPSDDPRFAWSDRQWATWWLDGLQTLFPDFDASQAQAVVTRDAYAQAVCPPNFSRQVPDFTAPLPGLYLTDSTQLYPADRNISGMLQLAKDCVTRVVEG